MRRRGLASKTFFNGPGDLAFGFIKKLLHPPSATMLCVAGASPSISMNYLQSTKLFNTSLPSTLETSSLTNTAADPESS